MCGGGSSALWGGYLGHVAGEKVEAGLLITRMGGADLFTNVGGVPPNNAEIATTDRSRTFVLGEVLYHFARGEQVRPFLGAAFGRFINAFTTTCRPVSCEQLWPLVVHGGRETTVHTDIAVVAGLSVKVAERIRIRTGARIHNIAAESLSTTEFFVEAGYRVK